LGEKEKSGGLLQRRFVLTCNFPWIHSKIPDVTCRWIWPIS